MARRFRCGRQQSGVAMVEFAFVLLPLVTLVVGVLIYSFVVVSQQAVAYAAQRAADAALQVDPDAVNFSMLVTDRACERVGDLLVFLPGAPACAADDQSVRVSIDSPAGVGSAFEVTVSVTYSFRNWGLSDTGLLPLPSDIRGQGFARVF